MDYVVVFVGVDLDIPLNERTFETKEAAKIYKHEHEYGKFATVLKTTGTFTS